MRIDNLDTFTPGHGWVLVDIGQKLVSDTVTTPSGLTLAASVIGDATRVEQSVRRGTIVRMSPVSEYKPGNYTWRCPVEVEIGDEVYFTPHALSAITRSSLPQDMQKIECGDTVYVMMPHKELVMKKVGNGWVGLNDYLICLPIPIPKRESGIIVVNEKPNFEDKFRVVYTPAPHTEYIYPGTDIVTDNCVEVEFGDTVIVNPQAGCEKYLEDEYNLTLDERYVYFQSRKVLAVEEMEGMVVSMQIMKNTIDA